ncbi:MAG: ABC transporter ATP-binding protein/permease [Candidatus Omnitrophica bacterium]|nr:ABC transporter ATP-binding protein/permease [Candidatus Omnitrophota bacterium]
MQPIIRVDKVSKVFRSAVRGGTVQALDRLCLEVQPGEIFGVLGPNGAGKTTLLNILTTLLIPDAGHIEILGMPLTPPYFQQVRSRINMSSGAPNFPWSLTVEENLRFYGRLYGFNGADLRRRVDEVISLFSLDSYRRARFDEISSGTKQRLALAKAILNEPEIIFFDEPTVGLDPDVALRTRAVIKDLFQRLRTTVVLTTHYMPEAEQLCEQVAFIQRGQVLALASPQELKTRLGKRDLQEVFVELAAQSIAAAPAGAARPSVAVRLAPAGRDGVPLPRRWIRWAGRCAAFAYRNALFARRNFFAFAELIFWPLVSLFSIGLMGEYLRLGPQAMAFVLTGTVAAGLLQVTQLEVAYGFLYEIWSKSVKHTFLTPVGCCEHLLGSWLIGLVRGGIIFALLCWCAVFFFGFSLPPPGYTVIFFLGVACFSLLVGAFVTIIVLSFGQKAEISAWMLSYVFMLLCGIYYPVETLPPLLAATARLVPLTYFLEFYRGAFGFQASARDGLGAACMLLAAYAFLEYLWLRRVLLLSRKKGVIVRLSE